MHRLDLLSWFCFWVQSANTHNAIHLGVYFVRGFVYLDRRWVIANWKLSCHCTHNPSQVFFARYRGLDPLSSKGGGLSSPAASLEPMLFYISRRSPWVYKSSMGGKIRHLNLRVWAIPLVVSNVLSHNGVFLFKSTWHISPMAQSFGLTLSYFVKFPCVHTCPVHYVVFFCRHMKI